MPGMERIRLEMKASSYTEYEGDTAECYPSQTPRMSSSKPNTEYEGDTAECDPSQTSTMSSRKPNRQSFGRHAQIVVSSRHGIETNIFRIC